MTIEYNTCYNGINPEQREIKQMKWGKLQMAKQPKNNQPTTDTNQPTQLTMDELIQKFDGLPLIQTKHLNQLFGFNDGGKYLRRHLRKHFTDQHLWGDSWVWKSTDKQLMEIIEYFTENVGVFNETKRLTISSLNPIHDPKTVEIK